MLRVITIAAALGSVWSIAACSSESAAPRACDATVSAQLQADARLMADALYTQRDAAPILDRTHWSLIGRVGHGALQDALQQGMVTMAAAGMTLEDLAFPEAPTCLTAGRRHFAIIPTLTTVSGIGGARVQSAHFQVGVLEPGTASWSYLDGNSSKMMGELFPEFPKDFKFPEMSRRRLP